ncbi:hypothetical protein C8N32_101160 [Rhodovulum imhoffii]|uniref:Uncharacterized protein n=1 Tax=Rhodovulum imhoffii TaxID=365340 RepID=A0A2T5BWF2_9RHOB|nr:pyridoxamine 5'-phosphate oxidase family protein [Rhodovulum imhoffii]MBK5935072.1 pyridoxamine 5-phosphate oxidase [Rhodovulum imhoffii]PTN03963.1 hypothetical protein C8N32_101160 [Rhodovulum imhoffii]
MTSQPPLLPPDGEARHLARQILAGARYAALAVIDLESDTPFVSRVGMGLCPQGLPISLMSDLALHTAALRANPACALLLGEPGEKGDPLTYPRLTLQCRSAFIPRGGTEHAALRRHYLLSHPKAQIYIDFADFSFVHMPPFAVHLNAGFGKAYRLKPADLLS